jgi:hypothetical protein
VSAYIYNIFERDDDCTECTGERQLLLSSSKKWVATRFLKEVLESGKSLMDYDIFRSRDGMGGTAVEIDPYDFMEVDLGEVL